MWECLCGCRGIAAGLEVCPMCGKEREMPKATSGGASNGWEPAAEPEQVEPAAPAVTEEPAAEGVAAPAEAPEAPVGDVAVMAGEPEPELLDAPSAPKGRKATP